MKREKRSFGSTGRTPGSQAFFEEFDGDDLIIDTKDGFRLSLFNKEKK